MSESPVIEKSIEHAKEARLRYVTDETPGITRKRAGKSFNYFAVSGKKVRDADTLARIRALVIPPAWTDVWICPDENGHLQATGRDARRRKQHRYHRKYRAVRDEAKYDRMIDFAKSLPKIHRATAKDLKRKGLTKERVLAALIQVMQKTLIRVGNEEYAKQNDSYGLTTLKDKHARVRGGKVRFEFRGKSGKEHEIDLEDPRLSTIVKKCQDLPGEQLFQYLDDDENVVDINSTDVNEYLRSIVGEDFTAKDFRTWAGTVLAARALSALEEIDSNAARKKNIVRAVEAVAQRLGNTKAVCRKCYIHPQVIDAYLDGSLALTLSKRAGRELARSVHSLNPEEAAVLALLQQNLLHASRKSRHGQNGRARGR
ncbi:MAG: DNA topoisomerase IB [Anaerolineae bacterium]|nr:DNA topoisomerase IB [Phycisphaerae bacterium]